MNAVRNREFNTQDIIRIKIPVALLWGFFVNKYLLKINKYILTFEKRGAILRKRKNVDAADIRSAG